MLFWPKCLLPAEGGSGVPQGLDPGYPGVLLYRGQVHPLAVYEDYYGASLLDEVEGSATFVFTITWLSCP